jgi:hypothetical protein
LELPLDVYQPAPKPRTDEREPEGERGVIILDLG